MKIAVLSPSYHTLPYTSIVDIDDLVDSEMEDSVVLNMDTLSEDNWKALKGRECSM